MDVVAADQHDASRMCHAARRTPRPWRGRDDGALRRNDGRACRRRDTIASSGTNSRYGVTKLAR